MLTEWVAAFRTMPLAEALFWSLGINLGLFGLAVALGQVAVHWFQDRPCAERPPPLKPSEIALSASCVLLNSLVMWTGIWLWQKDIVKVLLEAPWWRPIADVAVFLIVMDFAMYISHRIAHVPWIYPWVHQTHHQHTSPRPLTLFVLNPFEVLAFGSLWLVVISLYSSSWEGMMIYLALNLGFGTMGHLGVEPFPKGWASNRWIGWISTSTFHAGHHFDANHNYGFYSLVWDRLFGTLRPADTSSIDCDEIHD